MALLLVQHGKALFGDADSERVLSEQGIAEVKRIAEVASGYGVRASVIEHSGKTRARQTADIFAAALKPPGGVRQRSGINPKDDVEPTARELSANDNLMLVGHLPFMERLASYLITASAEIRVFKFQNGGIVCLDRDSEGEPWFIKWALMPNIG